MEDPTQDQIDRILDRVRSLDDLSADDVIELRRLSERSLVIDKFKVSSAEYWDWLDKVGDNIRGVEYDAQNARIILKGGPGWMHEATADVVREVFYQIRDRLSTATSSRYFLTGSKNCLLNDEFRSAKQADASLMRVEDRWPAVVLEVGISETTDKLYEDANQWLEGSDGQTKLVILIDVQETPRWKASNDKWGLSAADFQEMHHLALSKHILDWYGSKKIHLHGKFELSVHLWYSDHDRQCILNKAAFLSDNLIDLTTINDVPLRLEHLIPDGSDLDEGEHLSFPLRHLVDTLQNGFECIERDRADYLSDKKKRKYRS